MSELAEKYDFQTNQISHWKSDLISGAEDVFGGHEQNKKDSDSEIDKLHSEIGQLIMERDFLSKALDH